MTFQIISKNIIDLLKKRAREGIKIEMITLPSDSFKKSEKRKEIENFYTELQKNNVVLGKYD